MKTDVYSASKILTLITSSNGTTTRTGSAVNVSKYQGIAKVVLPVTSLIGGGTITLSIEQSQDGSTGWTQVIAYDPVTSSAENRYEYRLDIRGLAPFIRAVSTVGGTVSSTNYGAFILLPRPSSEPANV